MTHPLVIAMDGPSGTGKSTAARRLASSLGAAYLDTGAMYRVATLHVLRAGVDLTDSAAVDAATVRLPLVVGTDPTHELVELAGEDVSTEIRGAAVTSAVSAVSAVPAVRERLVTAQRALAADAERIVVEGRDIGTVVAPDAKVKLFLTASTAVRALRRSAELGEQNDDAVARTQSELERRDTLDSGRSASPLVQPEDALVIDSTSMAADEVADIIVSRVAAVRV